MTTRAGHEMLDLFMPTSLGHIDEYGKDVVPARPLSFDLANGGRPPRSTAPLLRLPVEILAIILSYIEPDSLATFALVNQDCLQLARSRQFVSIRLDYSDASLGILEKLSAERAQLAESTEYRPFPLLGPCVRRVTVATNPGWVNHRFGIGLMDETFLALPEATRSKLLDDAAVTFFGSYIGRIPERLNRDVTPHLELLD